MDGKFSGELGAISPLGGNNSFVSCVGGGGGSLAGEGVPKTRDVVMKMKSNSERIVKESDCREMWSDENFCG